MLPLDKYGLFISNFDGSNRRLLADGISYTVKIPAWGPDGWAMGDRRVHDQNQAMISTEAGFDSCRYLPNYCPAEGSGWLCLFLVTIK